MQSNQAACTIGLDSLNCYHLPTAEVSNTFPTYPTFSYPPLQPYLILPYPTLPYPTLPRDIDKSKYATPSVRKRLAFLLQPRPQGASDQKRDNLKGFKSF